MSYSANAELITEHSITKNVKQNRSLRVVRAPGVVKLAWEKLSGHRRPKLCGSSLDFEFIRECMKTGTKYVLSSIY